MCSAASIGLTAAGQIIYGATGQTLKRNMKFDNKHCDAREVDTVYEVLSRDRFKDKPSATAAGML